MNKCEIRCGLNEISFEEIYPVVLSKGRENYFVVAEGRFLLEEDIIFLY